MHCRAIRRAAAAGGLVLAGVVLAAGCSSGGGAGPGSAGRAGRGTWTIALRPAPSVPLTGQAASYRVRAQYPVVTSGIASPAARLRMDQVLQTPIVSWIQLVVRDVISQASLGAGQTLAAGARVHGARERTAVVHAGRLVTLRYVFRATSRYGGDAGRLLVLRTGTRRVLPAAAILTPRAATVPGSGRIAAAVNRRDPPARSCPGVAGEDLGRYLFLADPGSLARMQLGVQVGVARTGIEFFVDPGAQDCFRQDVVVPFGSLTGLVRRDILRLAAGKAVHGPVRVPGSPSSSRSSRSGTGVPS